MAVFAQLDDSNIVTSVVVFDGTEEDCAKFFNDDKVWRLTAETGGYRKNYAGIGSTYDPVRDAFILPKPSDTAVLDEDTCQWIVPDDDSAAS